MWDGRATLLAVALLAHSAAGHGCLTKAANRAGKTACAVNANDPGCDKANAAMRFREVIPRSGNDGVCANPPGCEAGFLCDWCGLEKVLGKDRLNADKWWTANPAAHWDQPEVQPQKPCMTNDAFGAHGVMEVAGGEAIDIRLYVNADHSGLYQYQIHCGRDVTNDGFRANPLTPWKSFHQTGETTIPLNALREVGYDRIATDTYFGETTCAGRACGEAVYRNDNNANPENCGVNSDCFISEAVTIRADACPDGDAVLRWAWNSAEGPETYANCLDLSLSSMGGAAGAGGGQAGTGVDGKDGVNVGAVIGGMVSVVAAAGLAFLFMRWRDGKLATVSPKGTNEMVVQEPFQPMPPAGAPDVEVPVDEAWARHVDPTSGRPYWFNSATAESLWYDPNQAKRRNARPSATTRSATVHRPEL